MPTFKSQTQLPVSAEDAYQWHLREGAIERLTPPWSAMRVLEGHGVISDSSRRVLRVPAGPLRMRWEARHHSFVENHQFCDEMVQGPFKKWVHYHRFIAEGDNTSRLEDFVDYELPLGRLGQLAGQRGVEQIVNRVFPWRHQRTRMDLRRHAEFADRPRLRVAISGASGFLGRHLTDFLTTGGHTVYRLVRRAARGAREITWDPAAGELDATRLEGIDAVVHLAGSNVGDGRWSAERKREILESRVAGTRLVAAALAGLSHSPGVLISASGAGFYGTSLKDEFDERDPVGSDFLADVCRQWEHAAEAAVQAGIRTVLPRTGIVLSARGGALGRMLLPFRMGVGGRLGSGRQVMSWIALDDWLAAIYHCLYDEEATGPLNLTSPNPITNKQFAGALGRILRRPAIIPVPARAIRAIFGEMGETLLLRGARVLPGVLSTLGFRWEFPDLESALRFELGRPCTRGQDSVD